MWLKIFYQKWNQWPSSLHTIAGEWKKAGKKDFANFVLSRSTRALSYLLQNTWNVKTGRWVWTLQAKKFFAQQTPMMMKHDTPLATSNCKAFINLVLFTLQCTVPFYRFLFSRYLDLTEHHFLSDILVPFPDLYSRGGMNHFKVIHEHSTTTQIAETWLANPDIKANRY